MSSTRACVGFSRGYVTAEEGIRNLWVRLMGVYLRARGRMQEAGEQDAGF